MFNGVAVVQLSKNVYAPVTIGHMFSGKAFAHATRDHMLHASAVLSLLLEEF